VSTAEELAEEVYGTVDAVDPPNGFDWARRPSDP
jgi:hypothetical protein